MRSPHKPMAAVLSIGSFFGTAVAGGAVGLATGGNVGVMVGMGNGAGVTNATGDGNTLCAGGAIVLHPANAKVAKTADPNLKSWRR